MLYVPFQDACLNMTANNKSSTGGGPRFGIERPGIDENAYVGIMKINLSTGEMTRIHSQPFPGTARSSRPQATSCSGATSTAASTPSIPIPVRCCGKSLSAA